MPKLYDVIDTIETNIRRLNVVASEVGDLSLKEKILGEISVFDFLYTCIIDNTTRVMVIAGDPKLVSPLIESVGDLPKEDVTNDVDNYDLSITDESDEIHSMIIIDPTDSIMELCRGVYQFDKEDAGNLPNEVLLDDTFCNAYYVASLEDVPDSKVVIMNFNIRNEFAKNIDSLSEWTRLIFQHLKLGGSGQK